MSTGIHQAIGIPFAHLDGVGIRLPTVSVVIGNYNQGRFVEDAIRSVAQQSYTHFDCVIVDDASTDNSVQVIEAALRELGDSRFRFVGRPANGGQMSTLFAGLRETSGPFVAFLDADDIWLPSFLETHIALHLNPQINAALSSSNLAMIAADGTLVAGANPSLSQRSPARERREVTELTVARLRRKPKSLPASGPRVVFVASDLRKWIWSPTSGLMFRRAVIDAVEPENTGDFRSCADLYLARFAHLIGGTIITHEVHGYYRMHGANAYSKHAILGDHAKLGHAPRSVEEATRSTMVRKLCTDPLFGAVMPARQLGAAVLTLLRSPEEIRMATASPSLRQALPRKVWRKLRWRGRKLAFLGMLPGARAAR